MTESDWGARIRALRKARKLTLDQMAQRTQLSRTSLSEIENGKRQLKVSQICAISDALGVSVRDIIHCDSRLSA